MKTWIGVLDCNNFFVSCERLFRPDLRRKPVVVLSSNDGCVVARSQEIKDMNVPMGVPYFKIKDILKKAEATTFSSHFALYRDISRRVFEVMRTELEVVEQYSIDEAFFSFTGSETEVLQLAQIVKDRVEQQVGIPVSVGIALSKTQAKYANFLAKKNGEVCVLNDEKWLDLAPKIPLSSLWGVGRSLDVNYRKHGLLTVTDLLVVDSSRLQQLFGVVSVRLKQELSGVSMCDLNSKSEPKQSITSSRSFSKSTTDFDVLADALAHHVRHSVADLRAMKHRALVVGVSIGTDRHGDFTLKGKHKKLVLTSPSNDTMVILKAVNLALEEMFESDVPYKKASVTLSRLCLESITQGNLFTENNIFKTQGLMPILDILNNKSGKELVFLGSRLKIDSWRSLSRSQSPAYTTSWTELALVKAN